MKCLLCAKIFIVKNDLKERYINYHRIEANNYFLKNLFREINIENFSVRKCYRCDEITLSRSHETQHNFINHYQKGGELPWENRNFKKTSDCDGSIIKFCIDYGSHKDSYDFFDPSKLLNDFFEVIDLNFLTDVNRELIVKSSFSVQNFQPPPENINIVAPLFDRRFWSTPTYNRDTLLFEFVKFSFNFSL